MAGSSWEALSEGQKGLGGPPTGPGGVWRPTQRDGRVWEALLMGQEWSGSTPGGLRDPPRGPGGARKGKEVLPEDPAGPEWARRPSLWAWRAQEALAKGQETLLEDREESGDPPVRTVGVGKPS